MQRDTKEEAFKRLFGVNREIFEKMKSIIQRECSGQHKKGGGPSKLSLEDKLAATLKCHRECRTMGSIEADYGVSESTVCEAVQRVEETVGGDKSFRLPGKEAPTGTPRDIQCTVYRS
jgi:hypothetical protein